MLEIGLVISVVKIKDVVGYLQHFRLSQPYLEDGLNKENENIFLLWNRWGTKSLPELSNLETEQESLRGFARLNSLV